MRIKFQPAKLDFKFECSVLCAYFFFFLIYKFPEKIEPYFMSGRIPSFEFVYDVFIPLCFVVINILFYVVFTRYLFVRVGLVVLSGVAMAVASFIQTPGIIDPVYFFIMATSCAAVIAMYRGSFLDEELDNISEYNDITEKLIEYLRDGYKYFLARAFQAWLALGASLGVSMSILFKDGYADPHLKFIALKMLLGFICVSFAIGFWVAIPMMNGIVSVQELLFNLKNDRKAA